MTRLGPTSINSSDLISNLPSAVRVMTIRSPEPIWKPSRWGDRIEVGLRSGGEAGGKVRCAFEAQAKHMNGGGFMHGGCMMTFADYALFCIATKELAGAGGVTLSFNSEFIATAKPGDLIEATGEIVKAGKSVIF